MTMNFPVSLGMRRVLPAVALASAIAALTGCVVAPAYPVVPQGEVVYAPAPPPPLRTEVIPVAPSPVHVWINGYWGWGGGRYAWTPGYWAMPPHRGHVWHPYRWQQGPQGWYRGGGRWGPR